MQVGLKELIMNCLKKESINSIEHVVCCCYIPEPSPEKNHICCLASNTCFQCKPVVSLGACGVLKQLSIVRAFLLFDTCTLIAYLCCLYIQILGIKQQNEGGAL